MSWEGLTVTAEGVVIGGDELRPGSYADALGDKDTDGGAIFKFVPAVPHAGGVISDLGDSPLVAGSAYAMQVSCVNNKQQTGQGCEIGNAAWVEVTAADARKDADAKGATGYYRPEDLHTDPVYTGPGLRFCWTNTGNEGAGNFAEVVCGVDSDPLLADPGTRSVVVNRFVEGDTDFNSFDNMAFQPITGNLYVVEDHTNGDIFACLPDGADRDIKSDGCVKILSVKDGSAEPTGFAFAGDGRTAYVSVQHSDDNAMPLLDDYPTDDIVKITGFKLKSGKHHD
jgi:secreted PhoX family phosphatase